MNVKIVEIMLRIVKKSPAILSVIAALVSVGTLFFLLQSNLGVSKELSYSLLTSFVAFAIGLWSAYIAKAIRKVSSKRVFISYPRSAKETAKKLASIIRKNGYKAWIDEEQINIGDKWETKIKDAIVDAEIFIALLNKDYLISKYLMFELEYAAGQDKLKILPVLLDKMPVPLQLERFFFVEAYTDVDKGLDEIVRAIT